MTVAPLIAMKSTKCDSLEAVGKERLDGLRWQLRTSPESSRREVRG